MIINLIKKSYGTIMENPAIMLFFVLFLMVFNYLASWVLLVNSKNIAIILIVCMFLCCCAFFSGWLQVIKESHEKDKFKEKNMGSIFLEGVGKNITSIIIGVLLYSVISFLVAFLSSEIAQTIFGSLDDIVKGFLSASAQNITFNQYFNNLSLDDKYIVYSWQISILLGLALMNFIFLFYFPAILDEKKYNSFLKPFVAIKNMFCFLFKNFFGILGFYILINLFYFALIVLRALMGANILLSMIFFFIYICFLSFVIMLIFNYYEEKNSCNNGSDGIG